MTREAFRFSHRLVVRWAEVDMQAIVFNGHYLTYFDVAFTEYWRAVGLEGPLEQARTGFEMFARKATIEYHASARFDDALDIYVRCARLGRTSLSFQLEIYRAQTPDASGSDADLHLVSGELVYVYANAGEHRSVAVPERWREQLARYEITAPLA